LHFEVRVRFECKEAYDRAWESEFLIVEHVPRDHQKAREQAEERMLFWSDRLQKLEIV